VLVDFASWPLDSQLVLLEQCLDLVVDVVVEVAEVWAEPVYFAAEVAEAVVAVV
jgi:hypothetical protein